MGGGQQNGREEMAVVYRSGSVCFYVVSICECKRRISITSESKIF